MCLAPVIVDETAGEVYYTPLYYTMAHFSKFIRPGAKRIGFQSSDDNLLITAVQNQNGSIALVMLNMQKDPQQVKISLKNEMIEVAIDAEAIQTIVLKNE